MTADLTLPPTIPTPSTRTARPEPAWATAETSWAGPVADAVLSIAVDVFTAMVDGEPGHLTAMADDDEAAQAWPGSFELVDPTFAWVDVVGSDSARVLLLTESSTAERLARSLLGMADDEPVGPADVVDAFGEVANVVGGNLKSLARETGGASGALTIPVVSAQRPRTPGAELHQEVRLSWRGHLLAVELWRLT